MLLTTALNNSPFSNHFQPKALANAVFAYASYCDNLEVLGEAVNRIAHKHVALGLKAEHYPMVGASLLKAIKEVLGDAATEEILDGWAKGYQFLADLFIETEKTLAKERAESAG